MSTTEPGYHDDQRPTDAGRADDERADAVRVDEAVHVEEAVPVEAWRGQWDEQNPDEEQFAADRKPRLRAEARSLLADLLRPYRTRIIGVLALVIGQVLATMAAPWLIGLVIDHGLPDALHGQYRTLLRLTVLLGVAALLSGVLQWLFLRRIGIIGQAVLFDLRRRVFDHTQRLSVSWHERFTSGRVISRLTSDVDTLRELLDASLDGLLLAVLNITVITVLMLVLDPWLALVALSAVLPLWLLFRWFSARSTVAFRRTRETVALLIVQFVETFNGIRAVQAFRREPRNDAIFEGLNGNYKRANQEVFRLHAVFIPGVTLVGNVATVAVLFSRRGAGGRRWPGARRADRVPAVPAGVLRPDGRRGDVLQLAAVGHRRAGEAGPGDGRTVYGGGAGRARRVAATGRRHGQLRAGGVQLRSQPAGAARAGPGHRQRPDGGAGRCHRRGQDHHRQVDQPLLRPELGHRPAGRDCRCNSWRIGTCARRS